MNIFSIQRNTPALWKQQKIVEFRVMPQSNMFWTATGQQQLFFVKRRSDKKMFYLRPLKRICETQSSFSKNDDVQVEKNKAKNNPVCINDITLSSFEDFGPKYIIFEQWNVHCKILLPFVFFRVEGLILTFNSNSFHLEGDQPIRPFKRLMKINSILSQTAIEGNDLKRICPLRNVREECIDFLN